MCLAGFPDLSDQYTRIEGTTWAEEMDLRDPFNEEEEMDRSTHDEVRLVEVGPGWNNTSPKPSPQ